MNNLYSDKPRTIVAFRIKGTDSNTPWRVKINGGPDPRNRDFKDPADIKECFENLQANGFYRNYVVKAERSL
jgi:hypothetical protein